MTKNKLTDESEDKKYFTLTPQVVWAVSRDPYDYALWSVVKMIAGENGECILSTEDLAQLAMMSTGKVSQCRKYLLSQGLLKGECRKDPGYPQPVWHLTVPNLWKRNVEWRNSIGDELSTRIELKRQQRGKSLHQVKPSPGEGGTSPDEEGTSPGETKDIHEEEPKEEPKDPADFSEYFPGSPNPAEGLPRATDGHQRAVDGANGGKADPVEQVTLHHYQGFMGAPEPLPDKKRERAKWTDAGRRLLNFIPQPWDVRAVCAAVDRWWANGSLDEFWKDKPRNDNTLELIAKYVKNGGKHATDNRRSPATGRPGYRVADPPDHAESERIKAEIHAGGARDGPEGAGGVP